MSVELSLYIVVKVSHHGSFSERAHKMDFKNSLILPVFVVGLGLAGRLQAQTFSTLHSFTSGSDGSVPYANLVLSGNTLYGTACTGGNGNGSVFAVNTDGARFTTLHIFSTTSGV